MAGLKSKDLTREGKVLDTVRIDVVPKNNPSWETLNLDEEAEISKNHSLRRRRRKFNIRPKLPDNHV